MPRPAVVATHSPVHRHSAAAVVLVKVKLNVAILVAMQIGLRRLGQASSVALRRQTAAKSDAGAAAGRATDAGQVYAAGAAGAAAVASAAGASVGGSLVGILIEGRYAA